MRATMWNYISLHLTGKIFLSDEFHQNFKSFVLNCCEKPIRWVQKWNITKNLYEDGVAKENASPAIPTSKTLVYERAE